MFFFFMMIQACECRKFEIVMKPTRLVNVRVFPTQPTRNKKCIKKKREEKDGGLV